MEHVSVYMDIFAPTLHRDDQVEPALPTPEEPVVDGPQGRELYNVVVSHPLLLQRLLNCAKRLTHNSAMAEDLLQDTLLRALENIQTFKHLEDLNYPVNIMMAWLMKIMYRVFFTAQKREKRFLRGMDRDVDVEGSYSHTSDKGFHSRQLEAALILDHDIAPLLADMNPILKTSFLHNMRGDTHQQVADSLGIPLATNMSRLFRARKVLNPLLEKYLLDDGE